MKLQFDSHCKYNANVRGIIIFIIKITPFKALQACSCAQSGRCSHSEGAALLRLSRMFCYHRQAGRHRVAETLYRGLVASASISLKLMCIPQKRRKEMNCTPNYKLVCVCGATGFTDFL